MGFGARGATGDKPAGVAELQEEARLRRRGKSLARGPPERSPRRSPAEPERRLTAPRSPSLSSSPSPRTISGRALERRPTTANRRSRIPLTANNRCD